MFSPWEGTPIVVPDPEFDFPALVKERTEQEKSFADLDACDPFDSGSPLTTPPSSPELKASLDPRLDLPMALLASLPDTSTSDMALPSDARCPSHAKWQSKANCKHKRKLAKKNGSIFDYETPPSLHAKHTHASFPIQTEFETQQAPTCLLHMSEYVKIPGKSARPCGLQIWLQALCLARFVHHPSTLHLLKLMKHRDAMPIIDWEGRIIAVMAGHPDDPDWDNMHTEVADKLEISRKCCKLDKEHWHHQHGIFTTLSNGISHGGGQMVSNIYSHELPTTEPSAAPSKPPPQCEKHQSSFKPVELHGLYLPSQLW